MNSNQFVGVGTSQVPCIYIWDEVYREPEHFMALVEMALVERHTFVAYRTRTPTYNHSQLRGYSLHELPT